MKYKYFEYFGEHKPTSAPLLTREILDSSLKECWKEAGKELHELAKRNREITRKFLYEVLPKL